MFQMQKVTMNLAEHDVQNAERLRFRLHIRNNAEAVSAALTVASSLSDLLGSDKKLIIRNKNGDMEKVIIPGLTGRINFHRVDGMV